MFVSTRYNSISYGVYRSTEPTPCNHAQFGLANPVKTARLIEVTSDWTHIPNCEESYVAPAHFYFYFYLFGTVVYVGNLFTSLLELHGLTCCILSTKA